MVPAEHMKVMTTSFTPNEFLKALWLNLEVPVTAQLDLKTNIYRARIQVDGD